MNPLKLAKKSLGSFVAMLMMFLSLPFASITKSLRITKKGATNVIGTVVVVVIVVVLVAVGAVVIGYVQGSIDTTSTSTLPAQARSQINATFTGAWDAWPLLTVIVIAVIVSAIIGAFLSLAVAT